MTRVSQALAFAEAVFQNDSSGHDFQHTLRVYRQATRIAEREKADAEMVQLAAILHDVDDRKLFGEAAGKTLPNARKFLAENDFSAEATEKICQIIASVSFKGTDTRVPETLEGQIVQDADRLDAIGAIGIGRAFAFGGSRGRTMHLPDVAPKEGMTEAEYTTNEGTTIHHFYEKLLLLRDMMNTATARELAEQRHRFMETFLDEFYAEWTGQR